MIPKVAAILLATTLLSRADAASDQLIAKGIAGFNDAFRRWDGSQFAAASGDFQKAATHNPGSATARYWLGVTHFHRMLYFQSQSNPASHAKSADAEMTAAISALESCLALNAGHAECHALLGTLFGMKIGGSALRAIRYGPGVNEHRTLALRHGAQNARVRYLSGAGLFHTSKSQADFQKALAELRVAEKLFASEAAKPPRGHEPRWGASSCQTFIGRTLEKLGHRDEAVTAYRKALAAHPADHIAAGALKRLGVTP